MLERFNRSERERRLKITDSLSLIDELTPQNDYIATERYTSHFFAARIRLAAGGYYGGEELQQRARKVLETVPALKAANDVSIRLGEDRKVDTVEIRDVNQNPLVLIPYESRKMKVIHALAFPGAEKSNNVFFEGILAFIAQDLDEGRQDWAGILNKRREAYFMGNEAIEPKILKEEIDRLAARTDIGPNEQVILAKKPVVLKNGVASLELFTTYDLKNEEEVDRRITKNYEWTSSYRDGEKKDEAVDVEMSDGDLGDERILTLDFGDFRFRVNQIPGSSGLTLNIVEKSFADYMRGNGNFSMFLAYPETTLVALDRSYKDICPDLFLD